jgi:hypothetical protein
LVGVNYVQFPITSTVALTVNNGTVAPTSCSSCCTGSANIMWSGGNTEVNDPVITIDGVTTASYSPATGLCAGSHTVCATDASSCIVCQSFTVGVLPPSGITENILDLNLAIFPNPASSEITLELSNGIDVSAVKIIDLNGRIAAEFLVPGTEKAIFDISGLTNGIYYLEIYGPDNSILRKKFAKTAR